MPPAQARPALRLWDDVRSSSRPKPPGIESNGISRSSKADVLQHKA